MDEVPLWLREMPKTDLHCHLGGSIRISTLLELASMYGIALPADTPETIFPFVTCKDREKRNLAGYLDAIKLCESVFVSPEAFQRVAYEVAQDAHDEHVNILELRFAPTNYVKHDLHLHEIVEATLDGLSKASKEFDMHTGLIICGIKTDVHATRKAVELATIYQAKGVVGFDLAGKEKDIHLKEFKDLLYPVMRNYLPITVHAGEEDSVNIIEEAVQHLNARRLGHALTLRENTKLYNYVDTTRVGIEICITSNVDTGNIAGYDTHPARSYFMDELRLSVNTDNRTISQTTCTQEYMHLMKHLGFSQNDVFRLAKGGIKSAFMHNKYMKPFLDNLDAYVAQIQKQSSGATGN
jgi:adenosine deaminase